MCLSLVGLLCDIKIGGRGQKARRNPNSGHKMTTRKT